MPSLGFGLEKLGLVGLKRPWHVLLLLLALTGLAIAGLPHIKLRSNLSDIFKSDTKYYQNYIAFSNRFPTSEKELLIYVEKKGLLERESLTELNKAIVELSFVEGVEGITSIFSINKAPINGGDVEPLIPEEFPESQEKYDTLIKKVVDHPLIKGSMLSEEGENGRLALLILTLSQEALDEGTVAQVIKDLKAGIEKELRPRGYKAGLAGVQAIEKEINASMRKDLLTFNVGGFLIGTLICTFFFRRFNLIIITSLAPMFAVIWAMGIIGWGGLNLNSFVNVIPPLLLVITFSDSLHMTFSIRRHLRAGKTKYEAAKEALLHIGPACVLTSLTTSVAMFSLIATDSEVIRDFGIAAGLGTLTAFIAVIIVVPVFTILLVGDEKSFVTDQTGSDGAFALLDNACKMIEKPVMRFYKPIAILGVLLAGGLTYFHSQLEPNYVLSEQIPDNKDAIKASDKIDDALKGAYSLHAVVNWGVNQKYTSPEIIKVIGEVHQILDAHKDIHNVSSVDKINSWLKTENEERLVAEKAKAAAALKAQKKKRRKKRRRGRRRAKKKTVAPVKLVVADSTKDLESYMNEWPTHLEERFLNSEKRSALITGHILNHEARYNRKIIGDVETKLSEIQKENPGVVITLSGLSSVSAMQSYSMIGQLKWNLLSAVAIVILLIGVGFRSLSVAILSIVPNLFPIVTVGAYLYFAGYGLQFASVIALTVAFGLAVDDTIHFMNRYRRERDKGLEVTKVVSETLIRIGPVLILSTLILICGMAVTVFSSMPILRQFGEMIIATLLAALVCDLVILPAIILLVYKKAGKGKVS